LLKALDASITRVSFIVQFNHELTLNISDIVHGDIKPQNILVFREPSGEIVAKIADFGHASMRATEDATINLPYSRFFNAPDYHPREIRLGDAKKFDSFNFGFLVYWLLVARKLMFEQKWAEENAFLASIQYQEDHILVAEKVLAGSDMSDEQMANLSFFFTRTLANHHQNRSADWDLFIALLTSQPRVNREQRDYETMTREDSDGDIREHSSPSLPHSNSNSNPELHPKFKVSRKNLLWRFRADLHSSGIISRIWRPLNPTFGTKLSSGSTNRTTPGSVNPVEDTTLFRLLYALS